MAIMDQVITDNYALYNGDCVEVLKSLPDQSIGLSVYSPPFCGLFHYSSSERDMSNCRTYDEFFGHYEYLVREIDRLTPPGRLTGVHCMDVPREGANAGERKMPVELHRYKNWKGKQIENRYSHWIWRQYASAFWDDVRIGRVLPYKPARDTDDEKHMHPLQLDVIERCVVLWSNPGEVVLTPFLGVGSEAYGAVINGRKAIGVELKPSYFRQAVKNLAEAKEENEEPDLYSEVEV